MSFCVFLLRLLLLQSRFCNTVNLDHIYPESSVGSPGCLSVRPHTTAEPPTTIFYSKAVAMETGPPLLAQQPPFFSSADDIVVATMKGLYIPLLRGAGFFSPLFFAFGAGSLSTWNLTQCEMLYQKHSGLLLYSAPTLVPLQVVEPCRRKHKYKAFVSKLHAAFLPLLFGSFWDM